MRRRRVRRGRNSKLRQNAREQMQTIAALTALVCHCAGVTTSAKARVRGPAGAMPVVPVIASVSVPTPLFHTEPAFVGATIDWWRNNDPVYGSKFGFGGALTIDLASPSLRAVAKGLSPGWLRIGGTPADGIVYEVNGGECANVSVTPEPTCQQDTVNKCDKCGDAYGCLKWQRWVDLLRFANETDMRIIFGLNGCRGRSGPDTPLDFSNIRALLNKTVFAGLGDLLHGVELGVRRAVILLSCPY